MVTTLRLGRGQYIHLGVLEDPRFRLLLPGRMRCMI